MTGVQIYTPDMECIAQIEDCESIIWTRKYNDIGTFEIYTIATDTAMEVLQRDNYVRNLVADDMAGVIKRVEYNFDEDGIPHITASGYDVVFFLSQRCLDGGASKNEIDSKKLGGAYGLKAWIDRCCLSPTNKKRKISALSWISSTAVSTQMSASGGWANLWDAIQEVLEEYQVGIKIVPDWTATSGQFGIQLYEGVNRTTAQTDNLPVIFSEDFQTITSYETYIDSSEYYNVAYVAGEENEDTGYRRWRVTGLGSVTDSGLDRCELYVDARDLQKKDSWTVEKYRRKLIARGREKLQECALVQEVEGGADVAKYQYRTHYDVGDKVTLNTRFGVKATVRISEVQETWDENGYTVEPTFETLSIVVGGQEVMAVDMAVLAEDLDFGSGTLEVTDIENYTCLLFYLNSSDSSTTANRIPIPVFRNTLDDGDEVLRGGNTFVSSGGNMYQFAVNCSIDGDTLTYVNSGSMKFTSGSSSSSVGAFEQRTILKIVGVF